MASFIQTLDDRYKGIFGKDSPSSLYKASVSQKFVPTEEEAKENKGMIPGETYSRILPPDSIESAWNRMENLHAQFECEGYQVRFFEEFGKKPSIEIYYKTLAALDEFINNAESVGIETIQRAFKGHSNGFDAPKVQEYLRLKHGYYKSHLCEGNYAGSVAAQVYGKYFLFRDWLIKEIENLNRSNLFSSNTKRRLSLAQIGLLYIYQGKTINQGNANEVARHFGHASGAKLLKWYNAYHSSPTRISSGKVLSSGNGQRVKDLKIVIDELKNYKYDSSSAEADLAKLKENIENDK
ncbi:hypothetical protein [Rufibacter psychrotolerans]|uniref:hypothetical protein n=1 Tax=Rufibacter psychrotolerans TaxID=2812556 RepID=UPI00196810A7|nr:hypothetical protein [Rufibacter sp. SYSU D00308]